MAEHEVDDGLRERIAGVLAHHHPTRGMSVAMGVTCECGYWTGSEPDKGKRPLPWGRDSLDLHRADVIAEHTAEVVRAEREIAWDAGHRDVCTDCNCRPVINPHRTTEERP